MGNPFRTTTIGTLAVITALAGCRDVKGPNFKGVPGTPPTQEELDAQQAAIDAEFIRVHGPLARHLSNLGHRVNPSNKRLDDFGNDADTLRKNLEKFFDLNNTSKKVLLDLLAFFNEAHKKASNTESPRATQIGDQAFGLSKEDRRVFLDIILRLQEALGGSIKLTGDSVPGLDPLFVSGGNLNITEQLGEVSDALEQIILGQKGTLGSDDRGDALKLASIALSTTVAGMENHGFSSGADRTRDGVMQDLRRARDLLAATNKDTLDSSSDSLSVEGIRTLLDRGRSALAGVKDRDGWILEIERPLNIYSLSGRSDQAGTLLTRAARLMGPGASLSTFEDRAGLISSQMGELQASLAELTSSSTTAPLRDGDSGFEQFRVSANELLVRQIDPILVGLEAQIAGLKAQTMTVEQAQALKLLELSAEFYKVIAENIRLMEANEAFAFNLVKPPKYREPRGQSSVQTLLARAEDKASGGNRAQRARLNRGRLADLHGRKPGGLATGKSRGVINQNPNRRRFA